MTRTSLANAPVIGDLPVRGWMWATVLAVALLARLVIVALAPPEIQWPDGREFVEIARSLYQHHGYGMQTVRAPGYPTLIAAIYELLGPDLMRLRVVEAVLGTLSVGILGAVGASLFGGPAGLLAAAMAAVHPVLALLPSTQFSENTLVLLITLSFAAAFAAWRRGGLARWALAGALFGLALLTRPNTVTLLPGVALGFSLALHRERRHWVLPLLTAGVAALLVISPWVIRNQRVHHRWFFVATGGGRQFWYGNNSGATGASTSATFPDSGLCNELARLPDEVVQERLLYERGMEFVRQHPGRAARLYAVKLGNLFALYPETISHSTFMIPASRLCGGIASAVIFLGALLALSRLRRTPVLWPMVGGIVTFALVNSVFFTVMRYRMAFEPCLLWMAGLGWTTTLWRQRARPSSETGAA
jgi:4-amino-4-deoxy-L-arabinose transferase-like glycosyltransferase